jgi:hypothetical protein
MSKHRLRAFELRKFSHPVLPNVEKYWICVRALDFPSGISTAANAREPVGLNRRVYKDVRASLDAREAAPGTFDLMNKGITILAESVRLVDKDERIVELVVDDERGGIVDGAHTARIIEEANRDETTNPDQYVEVYVRTGINADIAPDIARGLNTGMQVAAKSIYNIDGVFKWLKDEIEKQPYKDLFSWRESDDREYDVRDLIGVLELFNVFDFPNDAGKHPISAYEKWSIPLDKFADDFEAHRGSLKDSKYYRLRRLLPGALTLYDHIRRDFRDIHNRENNGNAGNLKIVEQASPRRGYYEFPFAQLEPSEFRLTKGATYPILAAFRNFVYVNKAGQGAWRGGFENVLMGWKSAALLLVTETYNATKEIGRTPDQIGKARQHWDRLHLKIQNRILREQMANPETD